MRLAMFAMAGAAVLMLTACSHNAANDDEIPQQATAAHISALPMQHLSVNCQAVGGTLAYSRQLDGSRIGMCQLINGKRCSESSIVSGNCGR